MASRETLGERTAGPKSRRLICPPWGRPALTDRLTRPHVLEEVNRLNCERTFGKFCFYEDLGLINIEYDLLGDTLESAELMNGLSLCAGQADELDDELVTKFRTGWRARDPEGEEDDGRVRSGEGGWTLPLFGHSGG